MKKLLAVVTQTEGGFRGHVPAAAGLRSPRGHGEAGEGGRHHRGQAHLAAGREGADGFASDQVEIVVAVEAPPPHRPRDDGMDALYDQAWRDFDVTDLEQLLDLDERIKAEKTYTFEEMMRKLGFEAEEPTDEPAE